MHHLLAAGVLEQAPDPIIALDRGRCIVAWSQAAARVFGLGAARAVGMQVGQLPGWPGELDAALEEAQCATAPVEKEVTLNAPEGKRRLRAVLSPLRDAAGQRIGTALYMHDITAAEQLSRMKDELFAVLSHELRTPLSAVLSWVQLLKRRPLDASLIEGLDAIQRSARLQAQLIDDLLDLARIVSGKLLIQKMPVPLADVVERALAAAAPAASAKALTVDKRYADRRVVVRGDANRLQQVMGHLLSNAVKFTPRGGRIEVELAQRPAHAEVEVRDTGQGIEPELLPQLFERFRQADAAVQRPPGGLGLSIVKQLVELHGGTVQAASPGRERGSVFTVRLPLFGED